MRGCLRDAMRARALAGNVKRRRTLFVTTGLDPVVHAELRLAKADPISPTKLRFRMDCRVKPGNDDSEKQ